MDIAVLSDIHGNHVAFQKCLAYALDRKIDTFIFLGDYVGELPYPKKTMDMLYTLKEKYNCFFMKGNREEYWINKKMGRVSSGRRVLHQQGHYIIVIQI